MYVITFNLKSSTTNRNPFEKIGEKIWGRAKKIAQGREISKKVTGQNLWLLGISIEF